MNNDKKYPIFLWWYYGDTYKNDAKKLEKQCNQFKISQYFYEELPYKKYENEMKFVKDTMNFRYLLFKLSLFWVYDKLKEYKQPILFLHSDNIIYKKPEKELFKNLDIGYSVGMTRRDKNKKHILSHCLYFNYCETTFKFFDLLLTKYKLIKGQYPGEHGLISNTILDFCGVLNKFKNFNTLCETNNKKWFYRNKIRPICPIDKKYFGSGSTNDTYIEHK